MNFIQKLFSIAKAQDAKAVSPRNSFYPTDDPAFSFAWTGEKTPGELSPIKEYVADYVRLAARSWQMYYESDIAQIVINNDLNWVLGSGLELKSEPKVTTLQSMEITLNAEDFSNRVEELFKIVKKSRNSTYSRNENLDSLIRMARLCKLVGGDVLYIFRFQQDDRITLQAIDGRNVFSPIDEKSINEIKRRGNRVVHGVELNKRNEKVAYWYRSRKKGTGTIAMGINLDDYEMVRVSARGPKSDRIYACMGYGSQYRIDEVRGMPILSALIETMMSVQEYRDATLGSAAEREKIAYSIEHTKHSTGENPLLEDIAAAEAQGLNIAQETADELNVPKYAADQATAQRIALTTKKQVFNMPKEAALKALESKSELHFKDFIEANFGFLCAALGQPPEVALMAFDSNFSASRMAGKMWEFNVSVKREIEASESYQPFKNLFIELAARKNWVPYQAQYLAAVEKGWIAREAFEFSRFVGPPIPHVDPVKEVQAVRLKLGDKASGIPLISPQDAAEQLACGDWTNNMEEFNRDYKKAMELFPVQTQDNDSGDGEDNSEGENEDG